METARGGAVISAGRIAEVLAAIDLEEPLDPEKLLSASVSLHPCGDRVLAVPLIEALTPMGEGGQRLIVRPNQDAGERPTKFLCLATGPGTLLNAQPGMIDEHEPVYAPMPVGPGDVFYASAFVGNKVDGYHLIKAGDVLMVYDLWA